MDLGCQLVLRAVQRDEATPRSATAVGLYFGRAGPVSFLGWESTPGDFETRGKANLAWPGSAAVRDFGVADFHVADIDGPSLP